MPEDAMEWLKAILAPDAGPLVWLTDLDDTLIDTKAMHAEAAQALLPILKSYMARPQAETLVARFKDVFDDLLMAHQGSSDSGNSPQTDLENRVEACQTDIKKKWGVTKPFSREVLLWLAAQDCDVYLSADQIANAGEAYWQHMTDHPMVFDDAAPLFDAVKERTGYKPFLMTASDARFTLSRPGQFSYDPAKSREFKSRRVRALEREGLSCEEVFIGDPVDKPDPEYFSTIFRAIEMRREAAPTSRIIVVGDSLHGDIATPLAINNEVIGIHCKRGVATPQRLNDRSMVVGSLGELSTALRYRRNDL